MDFYEKATYIANKVSALNHKDGVVSTVLKRYKGKYHNQKNIQIIEQVVLSNTLDHIDLHKITVFTINDIARKKEANAMLVQLISDNDKKRVKDNFTNLSINIVYQSIDITIPICANIIKLEDNELDAIADHINLYVSLTLKHACFNKGITADDIPLSTTVQDKINYKKLFLALMELQHVKEVMALKQELKEKIRVFKHFMK